MQSLPGMQDAAIIVALFCALIAGVILRSIYVRREEAKEFFPLNANDELRHYKAPQRRFSWLLAVAAAVFIVGLTSALAQRDEDELRAERMAETQLALKRLRCP